MQELLSKDTEFGYTLYSARHQAERKLEEARKDLNRGLAHALKWTLLDGIAAETLLAALSKIDEVIYTGGDVGDVATALERLALETLPQIGYYDPTTGSSSVGANVAEAAKFQGLRQVLEVTNKLIAALPD